MPDDERRDTAAQIAGLVQENAEFRGLLDSLPVAVLVRDRQGRYLYVNEAGAPAYAETAAEMIGRTEAEVLPPGNDLESILALDREVIDSGVGSTLPDHEFHGRGGRRMRLYVIRIPIVFAGRPAVLLTAFDSTPRWRIAEEQARLERKIAQTQRLEGLGLMAGGIAHDFNNLLVSVFANAELAKRAAGRDSEAALFIDRLGLAADRLAELSQQMLAYSGRGHVQSERVDVPSLAREMLDLLRASIPANVRLSTRMDGNCAPVNADRAQLSQIVMNLVVNAADAIGDDVGEVRVTIGGDLHDSTKRADLVLRAQREATEYVCIEVADDGPGMDPPTLERIFDPFFTTKATGRGLGLAAVLGIVRAHAGSLQVESKPGAGTRMRVWLPPADRLPARAEIPARPRPTPVQGRVLLVVDDEPMVREATSDLLEGQGFTVHTASDGDAAIEALQRLPELEVVLLDLTMPGRPAPDTHRELRRLRPDIPILITSGYSEAGVLEQLLAQPRSAFIQKPFAMDDLIEQLNRLIG